MRRDGGRRGERVAQAVERASSRRGSRSSPTGSFRARGQGTAGALSLETPLRHPRPWNEAAKRALIAQGYELLDEQLRERRVA